MDKYDVVRLHDMCGRDRAEWLLSNGIRGFVIICSGENVHYFDAISGGSAVIGLHDLPRVWAIIAERQEKYAGLLGNNCLFQA